MRQQIKDEDYSIGDLQDILLDAAYTEGVQKSTIIPKKPWQSIQLQALITERCTTRTVGERREISKTI